MLHPILISYFSLLDLPVSILVGFPHIPFPGFVCVSLCTVYRSVDNSGGSANCFCVGFALCDSVCVHTVGLQQLYVYRVPLHSASPHCVDHTVGKELAHTALDTGYWIVDTVVYAVSVLYVKRMGAYAVM